MFETNGLKALYYQGVETMCFQHAGSKLMCSTCTALPRLLLGTRLQLPAVSSGNSPPPRCRQGTQPQPLIVIIIITPLSTPLWLLYYNHEDVRSLRL